MRSNIVARRAGHFGASCLSALMIVTGVRAQVADAPKPGDVSSNGHVVYHAGGEIHAIPAAPGAAIRDDRMPPPPPKPAFLPPVTAQNGKNPDQDKWPQFTGKLLTDGPYRGCELAADAHIKRIRGRCLGHEFSDQRADARGTMWEQRRWVCQLIDNGSLRPVIQDCVVDGRPGSVDIAAAIIANGTPAMIALRDGTTSAPATDQEAMRLAAAIFNEHWSKCSDRYLASRDLTGYDGEGGTIAVELNDVEFNVEHEQLTAAAKLNGIQWAGTVTVQAETYRAYIPLRQWGSVGWGQWENDATPLEVALVNTSGVWRSQSVKFGAEGVPGYGVYMSAYIKATNPRPLDCARRPN